MNQKKTRVILGAAKEVHMTADDAGRWTINVTDVDNQIFTDSKSRDPIAGLERVLHKMFIERKKVGKGV